VTLLRQWGWTRWPTEVSSNPYNSVILWFCEHEILISFCCVSSIDKAKQRQGQAKEDSAGEKCWCSSLLTQPSVDAEFPREPNSMEPYSVRVCVLLTLGNINSPTVLTQCIIPDLVTEMMCPNSSVPASDQAY